jgi:hypothetical protein
MLALILPDGRAGEVAFAPFEGRETRARFSRIASHGTARMGDDPRRGVATRHGRAEGVCASDATLTTSLSRWTGRGSGTAPLRTRERASVRAVKRAFRAPWLTSVPSCSAPIPNRQRLQIRQSELS